MPLVSVVISTYNRADIVPYAVRSALLSDAADLEVIVVGDGCTDDTGRAIRAIGDPRVRFINLPENWGEQSVPNNEGIRLAQGEYVAFLNHDDLFLPWHLRDLLAVHDARQADVVWSPYVVVRPTPQSRPSDSRFAYELAAVSVSNAFEPRQFIVASATCYRREVLASVGGWTRASQTILSPSQDLLFKAHCGGFRIVRTDVPSVLVLYSGQRTNSYAEPSAAEHEALFSLLHTGGSALYEELLRACVHDTARTQRALAKTSTAGFAAWRLYRSVTALAVRFGMHPEALRMWIRHRSKGGFINRVRTLGGLPPVDFHRLEKKRGNRR